MCGVYWPSPHGCADDSADADAEYAHGGTFDGSKRLLARASGAEIGVGVHRFGAELGELMGGDDSRSVSLLPPHPQSMTPPLPVSMARLLPPAPPQDDAPVPPARQRERHRPCSRLELCVRAHAQGEARPGLGLRQRPRGLKRGWLRGEAQVDAVRAISGSGAESERRADARVLFVSIPFSFPLYSRLFFSYFPFPAFRLLYFECEVQDVGAGKFREIDLF
ncbi:hypothetical protein DFH09DRAFT_1169355 [Mycena vulgaris]|nr:hypothetical protein DFH09DRAFT_1169355 [Mycena vulgaris]